MTGVVLAILAAAPISVPRQGESAATTVQTPAGKITVSFEAGASGVVAVLKGVNPPTAAVLKGTTIEVSPPVAPGTFKTRQFVGNRLKCEARADGKGFVTESHDDLLTSREPVSDWHLLQDPVRVDLPFRGLTSASIDQIRVRLAIPRAAPVAFQLKLESPYALPPAVAEMLQQYQKLGATAVFREGRWDHLKITRVRKDACGDPVLFDEPFDFSSIDALGYPSPDLRLLTAHGWVFAEPVDPHRHGPIPRVVDFTRIDPKLMTYVGDASERVLRTVDTSAGKAVAVFDLRDFPGCSGSVCDAVNVREAVVTFADGALSTQINRPDPASAK